MRRGFVGEKAFLVTGYFLVRRGFLFSDGGTNGLLCRISVRGTGAFAYYVWYAIILLRGSDCFVAVVLRVG